MPLKESKKSPLNVTGTPPPIRTEIESITAPKDDSPPPVPTPKEAIDKKEEAQPDDEKQD